jgi:hypothetical protein
VAVAVAAQAPGGPGRYSKIDRRLTTGVARAFIDQTLAAVREADGANFPLVGAVERLHEKTAKTMSDFRQPNSKRGPRRAPWQRLLGDFVSGVDATDPQVWEHLRDRLLAGAGGPSGPAEPGLPPDNPGARPDLTGWAELADVREGDDPQDLADLLDLPMTQPLRGSPGDPEPGRAREPDLDQRGPDQSWLRRLVPDSPPRSAPATAPGQPPATAPGQPPTGANAPEASPTPDRAGAGGIPPRMAWGGSRKRARDEGRQAGSGGKRVARQQE